MISSKEFAMRWRAGLCRISCLVLAAWAVFCVDAEARTGKIVLAVTGDEPMRDDLKQLVEDFEKAQPLSGDSLSLLQGAQGVLARVNTALRSRGFSDARSPATIDNHPVDEAAALDAIEAHPEADQVTLALTIDTGPRFKVGSIASRGAQAASLPAIDMSKLGLAAGDPADAAAILAAQDLVLTAFRKQGYALASVKREVVVDHATREAEITFTVTTGPIARMGPVSFSGTEKVNTAFLQRRVPFKQGELNHIGQGLAIADTGFALRADFRKPDWWLPGQDARAMAEVLREVLPAYYRNAIDFGVGLDRILSPVWQVRVGLAAEVSQERRISTSIWQDYRLIGVPASVLMNKANSDVDPTKGYRLQLDVTPYVDFGPNNDFFTFIRLTGRSYLDLGESGRSVLALRASFGTEPTSNIPGIPPDKLFYAGGGGSVRGFVYQSAGPRDAFNNPLGGASVVEGSVEFRQRFGKSLGAVAFVDAGSAYPDVLPNFSLFAPRVGAGVGARYYTDFGPIRLDVGFPLIAREGDPPFGIYVSLGQAF